MKRLSKHGLLLAICILTFPILAQDKQSKKIYISPFNAYKTNKENGLPEKILEQLFVKLKSLNYEIIKIQPAELKLNIAKSKQEGAFLYIDGYYKRDENGNLNLYGQVYHPEKEILIDAFNLSNDLSGIEGITLDPKETKTTDEQNIEDFVSKISNRIKSNIKRTERLENIDDFIKK